MQQDNEISRGDKHVKHFEIGRGESRILIECKMR